MTTTYYLRTKRCETCGRSDEVAIGISAAGWRFKFFLDDNHRNAAAWMLEILKGGEVFDEWGKYLSDEDFAEIIANRSECRSCIGVPFNSKIPHAIGPVSDEEFDYRERTDGD